MFPFTVASVLTLIYTDCYYGMEGVGLQESLSGLESGTLWLISTSFIIALFYRSVIFQKVA